MNLYLFPIYFPFFIPFHKLILLYSIKKIKNVSKIKNNIIENNNEVAIIKTLNEEEFRVELLKKLQEECAEVLNAKSKEEFLEELADVLEILNYLAKLENKTIDDITYIAAKKSEKRGTFEKRIFLEKTYTK